VTRITIFLLLASALLVLSGLAAIRGTERQDPLREVQAISRPNSGKASPSRTHSTTNTGQATRPLPDSYRVLLSRSIFARDGRAAIGPPGAGTRGHNVPGQWVGPPGIEASLVFRGVTLTDGSYAAYIEDVTGGGVRRFSRGEDIAAGRIAGISLNGMDYQSGPKVTRIALGHNLAGGDAPPPPPPAAAPTSAPAPAEVNARGPWRGRPPGPGSGPEPWATAPGPGPVPLVPQ
jgi:hypothetical protein